jgi:hypothetical protein
MDYKPADFEPPPEEAVESARAQYRPVGERVCSLWLR